MSDCTFPPSPSRTELLRRLRRHVGVLDPSLHILAEEILGEGSVIDLVTVDSSGQVVLVMLGESGQDMALLTRALAQRAWVRARIRDWLKLAPGLDLRPDAGVRAILLCPTFHQETRAAAADLGREVVELATYRCLQGEGQTSLWVEVLENPSSTPVSSRDEPPSHTTSFRSGLTEEDFNLSLEEIRELEG
jgi:hypothetical protein